MLFEAWDFCTSRPACCDLSAATPPVCLCLYRARAPNAAASDSDSQLRQLLKGAEIVFVGALERFPESVLHGSKGLVDAGCLGEAAIFAVTCLHRRLCCFPYIGLAFYVAGIFLVAASSGSDVPLGQL